MEKIAIKESLKESLKESGKAKKRSLQSEEVENEPAKKLKPKQNKKVAKTSNEVKDKENIPEDLGSRLLRQRPTVTASGRQLRPRTSTRSYRESSYFF